ncbi:DUF4407 domain-containing protein [Actinomadura macra]|uniref:DUF4407 domain-containing protein n=1 Tax=Actinomadura macra TaxID=46164 RepID=UPI00082C0A31|nr:DUF4407 domain-containing protein [Actinomadura macra]
MRRLLIYLSGARGDVLQRCPTERTKFEGIGGAVLTTAVLAAISMLFALWTAFQTSWFIAVPVAVCWGLAIMSLDRWLVSTMPVQGRRRFSLALPRVLLGLLLGLVLSTPLVLRIFDAEIGAQIAEIRLRRADAFVQQSERGALGQRIAMLANETRELEKVIATGGDVPTDPATDPAIISLTAARTKEVARGEALYKEWQCELYGGSGCPSGRTGQGPTAAAKKADYDASSKRVEQLTAQLDARRAQLRASDQASRANRLAEAKARLPLVRDQYISASRQRSDLQASFDAENRSAGGLLLRLQALDEVSANDRALYAARILLFLLFVVLECLPVTVRLLQRPGVYERLLAIAERSEFREGRDAYIGLRGAGPEVSREAAIRAIRDIWESGEVPRAAGRGVARGDRRDEDGDDGVRTVEDGALRALGDTRHERLDDGLDLFPDDDL